MTELRRTHTKLRRTLLSYGTWCVPGELVDVDVAVGGVVERGKGLQCEADTVLAAGKADVALRNSEVFNVLPYTNLRSGIGIYMHLSKDQNATYLLNP